MNNYRPKPKWLRIKLGNQKNNEYVENLLSSFNLNTVCKAANCPNRSECYSKKTATFMILGNRCSRNCRFCDVEHGKMEKVDTNEPLNLAKMSKKLGLKHVVVTSVTRDDLEDGGAFQFVKVINNLKEICPETTVEVLIPDLQGNEEALQAIVNASPHVINHNIETIKSLYSAVRPDAIYERSLKVLENIKKMDSKILTKSGIMVGLGESQEEVVKVLKDLRKVKCDFITIGQYLSPSKNHYPIKEYIEPKIFDYYKEKALELGFKGVASNPLVRSSYKASEMYRHRR